MRRLTTYTTILASAALIVGTSACGGDSDEKKDTGSSMKKDTGTNGEDDGGMSGGDDGGGMSGNDGGGMSGNDGGGDTMTMSLTLSDNFPEARNDFEWEGWLVVDGSPVSTGQFTRQSDTSTYEFEVLADQAEKASKFILTLEQDEPGTPAKTKLVAGEISDDMTATADVKTEPAMAGAGTMIANSSDNKYVLNTPTTPNKDSDYNQGIWFLVPSNNNPSAGLNLPDLGDEGWQYEGWVVEKGDSPNPISTGTFTTPDGYDSDDAGPNAGKDEGDDGPPFPGQDFINGGRDLTSGYMAVVSIEPKPDTSEKPFAIKPIVDSEINDSDQGNTQDLDVVTDSFPTVDVSFQ